MAKTYDITLRHIEDQFGPDAFVREPYVWDADMKDPMQTSWETPRYSTGETVDPYAAQKNDPGSLLNFYKNIIHFRNSSRPLTYGDIEPSGTHIEEVVSFIRRHENEELLVLHNVSDVEVTIELTGTSKEFTRIAFDTAGGKLAIKIGALTLPAFTSAILEHD